MFNTNLKPRRNVVDCNKAMRLTALAFFLFISIIPAQGQTNLVGGTAFGTNYVDLATANSITSSEDGEGTLFVAYSNTTELTLEHDISGFIIIDNAATDFILASTTSNAAVTSTFGSALTVFNATNLTLTGGRYIGADGSGNGGKLINSTAALDGSEFTGGAGRAGMVVQASELEITDGTFIGGEGAMGLFANSNSTVVVNSGSFTGRVGNTAFYLQDSDVTVIDGTFVGNVGGTDAVFGDGLYSELTIAGTNNVALQGGTFSSVAFWGVDGSLHNFLAGTNLVIQNGIIQDGGLVVVDNQSNDPLQDLWIRRGTMEFQNAFTLSSNGVLNLSSEDSLARFSSDFIADSGAMVINDLGGRIDVGSNFTLDSGAMIFNDLGRIDVGGNFTLDSGAVVSNGLGHIDVGGSFTQSSDSLLFFTINSVTNGLLSATDAAFQTNATIAVDATSAAFLPGTNDVTLITTSAGITGTNIVVDADTKGRNSFESIYLAGGSNLTFRFTTLSLTNYWNATGAFGVFADELDSLITTEMNEIINLIDDPEISSRAVEQTYFTTFNTFQTAVQGIRTAVGESVARSAQLRDQKRIAPRGARGPRRRRSQQPATQIRGWGKLYGNYYSRSDSEGLYPSYDSELQGAVLGIDTSIGNLIVGISGGAGSYETTFNNNAREDTSAFHGSLYSTYGAERGYIDAGIAYGINQVETRTADPFRLDGDFDAQVINAYLGGGIDLVDDKGGTIFTPEAALQYAKYQQDGYTETGTAAVPRVFDDYDADSLLSSIGINVAMQKKKAMETVAFQLDGRLHWMHEFNADPSDMNFRLAGGKNQYLLNYPALDEEIYRIGIGCSFFNTARRKPKNIVFRVDFDELFGDGFNSHNLSAKVIYAF